MTINQISVFTENRFGTIRNVTKTLAEAGVDIRALNVADTEGFGILRMIVNDTKKAKEALSQEECIVSVTQVLGVIIPDVTGGLYEVLALLAEHNVNIEYMYAFLMKSVDHACVVLRVNNNEKVSRILTEAGISLLTEEQIAGI